MGLGTAGITAANLLKGSGGGRVLFLSSVATCSFNHSLPYLRLNGMINHRYHSSTDNWKQQALVTSTLSSPLSASSVFWNSPKSFCTVASSRDVESVSEPTTQSAGVSNNEEDSLMKILDVADMLDIRVGRIVRAWKHDEAESLYVEEVDVGEPEPRIICSGLVSYIPLEQLQDRKVVVLANLKPRNMRGVKSFGMLMAASDAKHENVELLEPPEASLPGERIWFGSVLEKEKQTPAATPNQVQKKTIWESVQPHLKTDELCVATLGVYAMRTSAGMVVSRSLKNANIS